MLMKARERQDPGSAHNMKSPTKTHPLTMVCAVAPSGGDKHLKPVHFARTASKYTHYLAGLRSRSMQTIAKLPTTATQKPRPTNATSVQATPSANLTSPMFLKSSGEVAGAG